MSYIIQLEGITKRFPGVTANDHIDINVEKGEIHTLAGENGAGKSTLMNILFGLYRTSAITTKGRGLLLYLVDKNCCSRMAVWSSG